MVLGQQHHQAHVTRAGLRQLLPFNRRVLRVVRQRLHLAQRHGEGEGAAQPGLAFQRDVAAHQAREAGADRQAQPAAAVAARGGRVGLREGVEDVGVQLGRDAHALVAHGHLQALR